MEALRNILENMLGARVAALVMKELGQIMRDKQQLFFLLFPPIVQICLYGCALNAACGRSTLECWKSSAMR